MILLAPSLCNSKVKCHFQLLFSCKALLPFFLLDTLECFWFNQSYKFWSPSLALYSLSGLWLIGGWGRNAQVCVWLKESQQVTFCHVPSSGQGCSTHSVFQSSSLSTSHNIYSHCVMAFLLLGFLFFPIKGVMAELKPRRRVFWLFITPFLTHGERYVRLHESVRS